MKITRTNKILIEFAFAILFVTPKPPKGGFFPYDSTPPLGGQGGENNEMKINLKVSEWYFMLHNCIMLRRIIHIADKNLSLGFNKMRIKEFCHLSIIAEVKCS